MAHGVVFPDYYYYYYSNIFTATVNKIKTTFTNITQYGYLRILTSIQSFNFQS